MADSIQRTLATMNAGAKGSAQYYEALANARGLNVNALRPYLEQLDEMTKKSALAADAQRKLDDSTKFLDSLRSRTEGIGKSASELAALRAEQLGVSDAAADMIAKLREQEEAGESSFGSLADLAEGAKVAFLAVAAAVAAAAAAGAVMVGDALNDLADLDGMAQKTGSSVESLSKIQKLAVVFGEDMGGVDAAIVKLSRGMAGLDDDSNKVQKALKTLGVSSRDAAGNLRDPSVVLVDASKSLQNYRDDAGKTALMNDLLSKSGADLLPFLNDLSENYDGVTGTSGEAAAAAAAFQDQIGFLKIEVKSLATSAAVALAPALRDLAGAFSDVYKQQASIKKGEWSSWADDLGLSFAKASDSVANFARYTSVAWDAFKSLRAGFMLVDTVGKFDSLTAGYEFLNGGDGFKSVKEAFGNLKQAVTDGWKSVDEVNNAPSDQFEKAYRARLASRTVPPVSPSAEEGDKPKPGLPNAAAEAAAREAAKAAAKAAEKAAAEYGALVDRINGKSVGIDADFYSNLSKLYDGYKGGKQSLQDYVDTVEAYIGQQQFVKQAEDERLKSLEKYQKAIDAASTGAGKASTDLQAQRDENDQIGLTKDALGELNATRIEGMALRAEERIWAAEGLDITGALAEEYRKEAAALRERAAAVREGAAKQVGFDGIKKAGEDLDKFLDPTKAQTFGEALKGAFGAAGDSMTQLVTALDAYGIRQAEVDDARKNAALKYATDSKGLATATAAINSKEVKSRLSGYGDMAAAAKGFFSEGSKGYSVLSNVERAYRAAELAMTIQSTAKKIFFKQTEVAANVALNAQKLGAEAATTTASTGLAATEASAWGVTAVVKAIASMPFPLNLAAGAATLAAVVAVGASIMGSVGGSSVPLSQQRQDKQGTGSVLGDSSAKSESIANSIDAIEGATLQGLRISDGMLASLRNIEAGIGQFASFLVQSTGVAGDYGKQFAPADGNFLSKIGSSIFGGKKTVEDTGFLLTKASFESILNGGTDAAQYADIKKSGGLFSSGSTSSKIEGLGAEGNRQIAGVLTSLYQTVIEASSLIGIGGDDFTAKLSSFVVDIGKVSLKGLTGAEIQEELSAVFSKVGDDLAAFGVDGLGQFQKVGEGYLETLSRVATNYQAVTVVTDSLGMVFDSVGLKSVGARERLVGLAGGLEEFTSSVDQFLADFYTDKERADSLRARITPTLDQYGIKTGAEDSLKQFRSVVTGLDLTTDAGARAYAALMQIAPAFKQIADVDADVLEKASDLANSKRELEIQIMEMLGDKVGALAATRALELGEMDASLRPLRERVYALEDEATALGTANSLLSIQAQIYELTGDKAGAAAVLSQQHINALTALDPALRGATQNLWDLQAAAKATEQVKTAAAALMSGVDGAFSALQKVVERQKKATQEEIDVRTKAVEKTRSLSEALRSTLDGLTVAGTEKNDRAAAQAQIQAALAIAKASGILPKADDLKNALSVIGKDSTGLFASQEDYLRDFYATKNGITDLAKITDKSLSAEERSLKALEGQVKQYDDMLEREQEQIDVLKGISTIGLSIEQAIQALHGAMGAAGANPYNSATSQISDAYKSSLGRAPDAAGLSYWQDRAAGGISTEAIIGSIKGSPEAQIQALYKDVFGRPADSAGLSYWIDRLKGGISLGSIRDTFEESAEKKLRGFAVGTNYVPADMPAQIHQGERIIPAADNRELMRRLASPPANNDVLAGAVDRLTATVARQEAIIGDLLVAQDETQRNTRRLADGMEIVTDGYNAMRTKEEVPS
ncbi:DUF4214 domain-containing protein [Oxalobacteraceae sp. CFBP 8755]|nr:DUF4214 domain-containing protein [Oxalobacteraceae sp. CFBP 8755]